ncbi:MAG TPA: sugar ABC transporter permease [Candidatus Hydrogenedentes bacterium]|mgnify:FL=1|nr:sugar ABC transporter permease [Candidatus Hydrogenedentota bacterium]HOV73158.1 sugar ABC transporter permease [Candidatus Hydrogenedentota bacterium]HPC16810.1 sugar ABC transporter permease [Candidatus Hydrogenedentota bacterium]HRT18529.1 sugar ABC transporter permease [Candidatus Hydrogenedentota bacterium]HRT63548.1 sugar ABC transporter permease [Candidatus Hydrogenedentota bacterium]
MMRRNRLVLATALCFLLPNFLGFLVFTFFPVLFSLGAAFTNWNLMKTVSFQWVGMGNFMKLFTDHEFWLYFINTIYFMLGMPVAIAASLFLAIILSQRLRGMVAYRTLFYLPSFTSGVALLILWKALYNPNFGPINVIIESVLQWLHLGHIEPPTWLSSTKNLLALSAERVGIVASQFGLGARDAIIIMGIWTAAGGGNMLLYLAGISNIPPELYEAAAIDGAGRWAQFRHVTWPQLAPTTFFIVIMSVIGGLQGGFEQARVMTLGGPAGTTTTLSYYIYTKAFEEFQIGYASAVAWVLFTIVFAITLVNWRFGSRYVNE